MFVKLNPTITSFYITIFYTDWSMDIRGHCSWCCSGGGAEWWTEEEIDNSSTTIETAQCIVSG